MTRAFRCGDRVMNALEVARFVTRHGLAIFLPAELAENEYLARVLAENYGVGALDKIAFVVLWRKAIDDDAAHEWDGEPLRGDLQVTRVDDPDNWKCTLFVFTHE
jgi:hypothetical protein